MSAFEDTQNNLRDAARLARDGRLALVSAESLGWMSKKTGVSRPVILKSASERHLEA